MDISANLSTEEFHKCIFQAHTLLSGINVSVKDAANVLRTLQLLDQMQLKLNEFDKVQDAANRISEADSKIKRIMPAGHVENKSGA